MTKMSCLNYKGFRFICCVERKAQAAIGGENIRIFAGQVLDTCLTGKSTQTEGKSSVKQYLEENNGSYLTLTTHFKAIVMTG